MDTILQTTPGATPPTEPTPVAVEAPRTSVDRFGARWINWLKMWMGSPSKRRLAYGALQIGQIRHWEKEYAKLTDKEILQKGYKFKGRARGGETLDSMLPE